MTLGLIAILHVSVIASPAYAQSAPTPEIVKIWPGQAPGTEDWKGPETDSPVKLPGAAPISMVSNVTVPTLTVYRPKAETANGTAMIVVPGGGFQTLAMTHEGEMVALWLAERGITAFVLKYRVRPIAGFKMPQDLRKNAERFREFADSFLPGRANAYADATQSIRFLRANAARFAIAPDRLGMIGFSAGAITTMAMATNESAADRPNFAAPIYGAMLDKGPPVGGPPLFIAVTQDDNAVPAGESINIFTRWTAANLPAELHIYESGGHGFGMMKKNKPVDGWITAYEAWLRSHGWMGAPKAP
ncbi:alpha/beta hydrolase [Sphingobium boeckii]|uniref:Acetyl esterase/lipase n=1 Tax=Sphingobium boeckii TaxID=1082345 RepID=A0A7W9EFE4_9SPHN|nr:alpha/beta hydrolase [Sphingobium boeckii]MBB5685955.1 acetyl esterase/lipase [Sphingobium boeckii]